jgi:hypothetical protein
VAFPVRGWHEIVSGAVTFKNRSTDLLGNPDALNVIVQDMPPAVVSTAVLTVTLTLYGGIPGVTGLTHPHPDPRVGMTTIRSELELLIEIFCAAGGGSVKR